jgi:tryptophan 2,3-dioxygenase
MSLTYSSYLKLKELLSLQKPLSEKPEHDEMLFIVIHQVFELWFKEMLHELDHLKGLLAEDNHPLVQHTLKRILTVLKIQVAQIDVLETMTPVQFQSFRDRLESASGFQSTQFRELEFVLGHKRPGFMEHIIKGSPERDALERRYREESLWDVFLKYVARQGYDIPKEMLKRDVTHPVEPSKETQQCFMQIYQSNETLTRICELLVDLDEGIQEWRYRHVKMVERTIGNQKGTGGSSGVAYLKSTLFKPSFPDLWAFRTEL